MNQKKDYPQFAFTGLPSAHGFYVGYVNIRETEHGIVFTVRSEGDDPPTASYEVPKSDGVRLLGEALKGITAPPPSCPYCGTTEGLRVNSSSFAPGAPEYICEGCFTPTDDGPCFDDLRKI
ncbi:hypothetical protein [Mesorhizobium sp.]|uniref:hypothetical protein n=1 Tax=Mesorhizobium sp. TaxID=1871066 RepID=UPI000FE41B49|nr:hypothetical protein [Mesorhizobium sp.]RWK39281.1 MAG: hypothetical protein EOR40_04525 [Mesorhizobium sp.]